jgi:hypothetical protein
MSHLLRSVDDGEEEEEVASDKNLGKRKKSKKLKSSFQGRRGESPNKIQVVNEFCKAVQLLHALFEGRSNSIIEFREEVFNSEENFVKISNIFVVMRNILDRLVSSGDNGQPPLFSLEGRGGIALLSLQSSLTLAVQLWLSVLCQRAALQEDSSSCDEVSRATSDMSLAGDEDEEEGEGEEGEEDSGGSRGGRRGGGGVSAPPSELDTALSWMTNCVLGAFLRHSQTLSRPTSTTTTSSSGLDTAPAGHKKSRSQESSPPPSSSSSSSFLSSSSLSLTSGFLDSVLSSSLSVLTDALLSGISTETILAHLNNWVSLLHDISANSSREARVSTTINALSRLAFAIYSTKIRLPLLGSEATVSARSRGRQQQQATLCAFDATLLQLWEGSVECVLLHVQSSQASSEFHSDGDEEGEEREDEDKEDEGRGSAADANSRKQTDSIDLRILYSMLQLPNLTSGAQSSESSTTKKAQFKYASELLRRILSAVCASAAVKEGPLAALLASTPSSSAAALSEEEQAGRNLHLSPSQLLQWSKSGDSAASLLDILLRKVCLSENVAKFVLKCLRSMLLEAIQAPLDTAAAAAGEESVAGRGRALLLAVLVKQVMMKSTLGRGEGNVHDAGGGGGGAGDGTVGLILSAVEKLVETDRDTDGGLRLGRDQPAAVSGSDEREETGAEGEGGVAKEAARQRRADLSSQIVGILRL